MKITYFTNKDKKKFNEFVEKHELGSVQQSFEWGKIASATFWALAALDNKIRATALIIRKPLPFGKCWLLAPRGPICDFKDEVWQALFQEIKKIAKKENAVFLRIEPPLQKPPQLKDFKKAHASYQPERTIKLDLSLSEGDLLKQMKPKGRYNIRLAEKKGVKVTVIPSAAEGSLKIHCQSQKDPSTPPAKRGSVGMTEKSRGQASVSADALPDKRLASTMNAERTNEAVEIFYNLLQQTTTRDKFQSHPKDYYQNFLEILGQQNAAKLYLAKHKNEIIAGILVTFFGEEATYYYGASSNEYRNLMAPYLLQWEAMRDAKQKGLKWYDLFGIAPENQKNHPWAGVTQFKTKFGGKIFNYAKALEYVFQPFWYNAIKIAKKIK